MQKKAWTFPLFRITQQEDRGRRDLLAPHWVPERNCSVAKKVLDSYWYEISALNHAQFDWEKFEPK